MAFAVRNKIAIGAIAGLVAGVLVSLAALTGFLGVFSDAILCHLNDDPQSCFNYAMSDIRYNQEKGEMEGNTDRYLKFLGLACKYGGASACIKLGAAVGSGVAGGIDHYSEIDYYDNACKLGDYAGCFLFGAIAWKHGIAGSEKVIQHLREACEHDNQYKRDACSLSARIVAQKDNGSAPLDKGGR